MSYSGCHDGSMYFPLWSLWLTLAPLDGVEPPQPMFVVSVLDPLAEGRSVVTTRLWVNVAISLVKYGEDGDRTRIDRR